LAALLRQESRVLLGRETFFTTKFTPLRAGQAKFTPNPFRGSRSRQERQFLKDLTVRRGCRTNRSEAAGEPNEERLTKPVAAGFSLRPKRTHEGCGYSVAKQERCGKLAIRIDNVNTLCDVMAAKRGKA
jgi:hypothetical protein